MAMPVAAARRYTVEEVLAFPEDGNRYELIRGELLVSPSPALRHQVVVQRLYISLIDYLRPLGLHESAFCVSADISWGDDTLVQPDVFVATAGELRHAWRDVKTLLLAVEVLSPRSSRADRVLKRDAYREHGVGTYWIVDHRAGVVEVWRPGDERPEIVSNTLRWRIQDAAPELTIDFTSLFEGLPED